MASEIMPELYFSFALVFFKYSTMSICKFYNDKKLTLKKNHIIQFTWYYIIVQIFVMKYFQTTIRQKELSKKTYLWVYPNLTELIATTLF